MPYAGITLGYLGSWMESYRERRGSRLIKMREEVVRPFP